jgi:N-acetylneuraminic acid mutarotase
MKRFIMALVVTIFCSFMFVNMVFATADTWTKKSDFGGTARVEAVGFSIEGKGYIGTGSPSLRKDFWEYDPETDTWTQKADFGGAGRQYAVGFAVGKKGYVGTGNANSSYLKDFWEYDPASNIWMRKADFGGVARYGAVGFSVGNKGYIGTGWVSTIPRCLKDFWEYDPVTNTWTRKADFGGEAREEAVGFSIGNKGYIGTGSDGATYAFYKDFWEYNPVTNIWTRKADFGGIARWWAVGFSIAGKGYIGTGSRYMDEHGNPKTTVYKDFWEYDPATDIWIQRADVGVGTRGRAVGFSIGNRGFIGTGWGQPSGTTYAYYKDFWEYEPVMENVISLNPVADITSLWPPNNKMVEISIQANASDSTGEPVTLAAEVTCNEEAVLGEDWMEPLINQETGIITVFLNATRDGNGTGRIYTITITATGTQGNSETKTVTVVVPHDQGKK